MIWKHLEAVLTSRKHVQNSQVQPKLRRLSQEPEHFPDDHHCQLRLNERLEQALGNHFTR